MKPETNQKLQNAFLAAMAGAVIPIAIGFGGGFLVTRNTADQMASGELLTARTKICIAQFSNAPNYQERRKEFKALDYSGRRAFMEKGGWAKMPGDDKASDAVKEACATGLEALDQK